MPGIASKRAVSSSAIARRSSAGRRAGDDRERDLGADAADAQQVHEEVTFVRGGEAVELERVLADDEVRLDGQLVAAATEQRGRRLDQVADAVHVEDEARRREPGALAAQTRDHAATLRGAVAWQIATANASDACMFSTSMPRTSFTIRCTCAFSARP